MSAVQVPAAVFPGVMPKNGIREDIAAVLNIKSNLNKMNSEILDINVNIRRKIDKMKKTLWRRVIGPVCTMLEIGFMDTPEVFGLNNIDEKFHTLIDGLIVQINNAMKELLEEAGQWPDQVTDVSTLKKLTAEERKKLLKGFKNAETITLAKKLVFQEFLMDCENLKGDFRKHFKACIKIVAIIYKDFADEDKENRVK